MPEGVDGELHPRHVETDRPSGSFDVIGEVNDINKFREIEAKFDSSCFVCRDPLRTGSKVWWKKGHRVRCDDCTPEDERFVSTVFDDRDVQARNRRDAFLEIFVWKYKNLDEEGKPLLEELRGARGADEIHGLIDEIVEHAVPVKETAL